MITPQQQYFEFMCHLHEVALGMVSHLRFDKKHPWQLHLVSLYGTMLELLGSTCILIREGVSVGVPILLRCAIEANLDFVNLSNDRKYGYNMRAAELKEWIKIFREAEKGTNPFISRIAGVPNLKEVRSQWEADLGKLKEGGVTPLRQDQKFDKAGEGPVYGSVYNFLCCHSHNNIRALLSRHVNISGDQNDFSVEIYPQINYGGLLPYVDSFCGIIVTSTERIHSVLQSDAHDQVGKLKLELIEWREEILSKPMDAAEGHSEGAR